MEYNEYASSRDPPVIHWKISAFLFSRYFQGSAAGERSSFKQINNNSPSNRMSCFLGRVSQFWGRNKTESKPSRRRVWFGEEEQQSEREMAFDAKHKKAVASDTKLATTMAGSANFEDRCRKLFSRKNIACKTLTSSKLRLLWAKNRIEFFFLLQLLHLFRFAFEFWGW